MPILIITFLALGLVLWLASEPLLRERRRRRLRARPFPAHWRAILRRRVPYIAGMPADLQMQLKGHMQVFLAEKRFIGCAGLAVTEDMRVTIAAQACLLLLNRKPTYYPQLRQILVYPNAFIVDRVQHDAIGLVQEDRQVLAGESWSQGQVVLSWDDTLDGAADPHDGHNVVIHEFAHQLDQEKGHANGAPYLAHRSRYKRWSDVFSAEYARLQAAAERGEASLLDHYGATDPAEFFAVASEVFYECPHALAEEHPALYRELRDFYGVDPVSW